ncbi:MAG TPA: hypothetical protein VNM70_16180 [Burkholderiales bacterium]|nr:hypothetical protein [Burkholderiales bacterium]
MDSRNREENRADLGRVLLALVVLALLAALDDSRAPRAAFAVQNAVEAR